MSKQNTDVKSLAHTKWNCKYHIVFAPKYRRKVFYQEKRESIRDIIRTLCQWKGVEIIEGEICPDHIHLLLSIREFDSWISEKSTCRSHKTCFFCVKFLVFIYCILLQCVVKYNKGGILHASYYIEI